MKLRVVFDYEDECESPHPNANTTDYYQHFSGVLDDLSRSYGGTFSMVEVKDTSEDGQ